MQPANEKNGTVTNTVPKTQQYEQAGITWYTNGKPRCKIVQELIDGQLVIIPERPPTECRWEAGSPDGNGCA